MKGKQLKTVGRELEKLENEDIEVLDVNVEFVSDGGLADKIQSVFGVRPSTKPVVNAKLAVPSDVAESSKDDDEGYGVENEETDDE